MASDAERDSVDAEVRSVLDELERLMAELRPCVDALQAVTNTKPEVPGDDAITTA